MGTLRGSEVLRFGWTDLNGLYRLTMIGDLLRHRMSIPKDFIMATAILLRSICWNELCRQLTALRNLFGTSSSIYLYIQLSYSSTMYFLKCSGTALSKLLLSNHLRLNKRSAYL